MLRLDDPAESETMGVLNFPLRLDDPAESETIGVLNFLPLICWGDFSVNSACEVFASCPAGKPSQLPNGSKIV